MNIILTSGTTENAVDEHHEFITIGPNCWGKGKMAREALKNCKANAPRGSKLFVTRVGPVGCGIDCIDGSVEIPGDHDASICAFCTIGKGIRINTDKTFKECGE